VRAGGGSGVLIAVVVVVLGVLLIVGILAAIAIPSFVKYQRRAESAEARTSLSRIAFGATARYDEARAELGAAAAAFPASTDWTPAVPPCETGSPRYPGGEQDWAHPTWQALHFVMATPHRYRYKFTAAGTGASASFVAEAEGDLNCNGVRAHFVRRGRVVDGRVELAPLESTNPLD
jgi:type II secretory pathway pseudopilin PulG